MQMREISRVQDKEPADNNNLFLDPSRISMADVDTDWPDDRRQEVIDYIIEKYGADSCCQIITFGTMKAKKAVGDVGRAIGMPQKEYLAITKMIPNDLKITIKKALATAPELRARYESSEQVKYLLDIAMQLEGLPCHISTHAAGMLVADSKGLKEHVPLARTDKGVVAQYAMGNLDDLGMLKLDLLGLNTLKIIVNTIKLVKQNYGVVINPYDLYNCDDLKVLEVIQKGWTEGIFQLEGGGMTAFMRELAPIDIEEVTAGVALYRPGPMDMIPQYIEGKRDASTIHYDFPELEPVFKETYGVMTYQEQTMKSAIIIAGYQKHHSDSLRKAIGKKKEDLMKQHRTWFIDGRDADDKQDAIPGGVEMGYDRDQLVQFFDKMEKFGSYAFNKSHAACYAVLAYATAWLKYYYPTEFMAVNMDEKRKDQALLARYIKHCTNDLGIEILPISINDSRETFTALPEKKIIFSLAVKETTADTLIDLVTERNKNGPFRDMNDFLFRMYEIIDRKSFKALAFVGAFDCLKFKRSSIAAGVDDVMDAAGKCRTAMGRYRSNPKSRRKQAPHLSEWISDARDVFPNIAEFPQDILLRKEKFHLGVYLSGHPLKRFQCSIESFSNFNLSDLAYDRDEETGQIILGENVRDGLKIQLIAQITSITNLVTREKKQPMAAITIEDLTGSAKGLIWPDAYTVFSKILKQDQIYRIKGNIKAAEDEEPFIAISHMALLENDLHKRVVFNARRNLEDSEEFIKYLSTLPCAGDSPVYVRFGLMQVMLKKRYWVDAKLFEEICKEEFKERCIISEW